MNYLLYQWYSVAISIENAIEISIEPFYKNFPVESSLLKSLFSLSWTQVASVDSTVHFERLQPNKNSLLFQILSPIIRDRFAKDFSESF